MTHALAVLKVDHGPLSVLDKLVQEVRGDAVADLVIDAPAKRVQFRTRLQGGKAHVREGVLFRSCEVEVGAVCGEGGIYQRIKGRNGGDSLQQRLWATGEVLFW